MECIYSSLEPHLNEILEIQKKLEKFAKNRKFHEISGNSLAIIVLEDLRKVVNCFPCIKSRTMHLGIKAKGDRYYARSEYGINKHGFVTITSNRRNPVSRTNENLEHLLEALSLPENFAKLENTLNNRGSYISGETGKTLGEILSPILKSLLELHEFDETNHHLPFVKNFLGNPKLFIPVPLEETKYKKEAFIISHFWSADYHLHLDTSSNNNGRNYWDTSFHIEEKQENDYEMFYRIDLDWIKEVYKQAVEYAKERILWYEKKFEIYQNLVSPYRILNDL